jgi:hypothetical protein
MDARREGEMKQLVRRWAIGAASPPFEQLGSLRHSPMRSSLSRCETSMYTDDEHRRKRSGGTRHRPRMRGAVGAEGGPGAVGRVGRRRRRRAQCGVALGSRGRAGTAARAMRRALRAQRPQRLYAAPAASCTRAAGAAAAALARLRRRPTVGDAATRQETSSACQAGARWHGTAAPPKRRSGRACRMRRRQRR